MKCLNCKWVMIKEHCFVESMGFSGETVLECGICNEIKGEMCDCEDFEEK